MAKIDHALWRDIMDYLRRRHAPICRQWFEELAPLEMNSGLLKVHTSSAVQQNYLQRKCIDQFIEAAQAATGALVSVRFVTEPLPTTSTRDNAGGNGNGNGHDTVTENHRGGGSATATSTAAPGTRAIPGQPTIPQRLPIIPPRQPATATAAIDSQFDQIVISPDYSFENFVTGPGNQLACAAAVAVSKQPGTAYNPLFIHGGVGLGKTHLLQAICQTIMQQNPQTRILYLSCDSFRNQFLQCVQDGNMAEFRHRYRHVDVLVIDDIHFLANKDRSQEEFFHTFNDLYHSNRQIVLSSDSPPSEIPQLEERLVSRFQWGLVAHVSKPCYETRVAIIRAKAKIRGLEIPDEVVSYIATKIDSNARELEGAITTIQGHAALQNKPIDMALAQSALGESVLHPGGSQITLQNIINAVTSFYAVKLSDLQSKRRHKSITGPRQVCMWLARKRTRFSLEEIGGYFGGRDHTTVMHSIRTVDDRMSIDQSFTAQIEKIDEQITRSNNQTTS